MEAKQKAFTVAVASALGLFAVVGSASAATVTCTAGSVDYSAANSSYGECFDSNPPGESSPTIVFNSLTWTRGISDSGSPTAGSPLSWVTDPMDVELGVGMLPWSIALATDWVGKVLLQLKQSNTHALFDVTDSCNFGTNLCTGTWSTSGPGGSSNDLSNTRAYYITSDTPPPPGEIPLPAAAWLMLAGLGGLGALKLRKKA